MTNDVTLQFAGVVNQLIKQQIFIKSLMYSKLLPSVEQYTASKNYHPCLAIYLKNRTTHTKSSDRRQNVAHYE